ncbi:MAG: TIGR03668 family PPOX class F420-dependent oxidoreductase, partial [Chloroflexi bacterium]|nr:TIGR03668 family PPOX class F420-dependent oxidoreductase [Chloroflexota bacterium]
YSDDWSRLAWLMVRGRADVVPAGRERPDALRLLRAKYPQYRAMALEDLPLLAITPQRVVAWGKIG